MKPQRRDWLIDIRGKKTQVEVAADCGISPNFYNWIETGERNPRVDKAKRIADVMSFSEYGIDWTKFYEDNPVEEVG